MKAMRDLDSSGKIREKLLGSGVFLMFIANCARKNKKLSEQDVTVDCML